MAPAHNPLLVRTHTNNNQSKFDGSDSIEICLIHRNQDPTDFFPVPFLSGRIELDYEIASN